MPRRFYDAVKSVENGSVKNGIEPEPPACREVEIAMNSRCSSLKALLTLAVSTLVVLANLNAVADERNDLPDIGGSPGVAISLQDEYQIGRMMVRGLRDQGEILDDPESLEYVQAIGEKLASFAQKGDREFQFLLHTPSDIQAFAMLGGFIVVYPDLILASRNESELAGVMAHEISHVTQRHIVRQAAQQSKNSIVSTAAMLAAILLGAAAGGDAAIGGLAAAQSVALQQQMSYSREMEFESDAVGVSLTARAGFDPNGSWSFFDVMQRMYGGMEANIPAILLSHPVSADRIADLRARTAKLAVPPDLKDSLSYQLTKERLRVLTTPSGQNPRDYYAGISPRDLAKSPALQYGKALAAMTASAPKDAVPIFSKLLASDATVVQYHTALGQAQMLAGDNDEALRTFEQAVKLFPRNVPVTVRYGETLMRLGQPKEAHQVLLDLFNNVPPTPEQAKLIALAANSAGDAADAYSYMGEYYIMGGDLPLAMTQLQLALTVPNITAVQRAKFESRLEELQQAMPRKAFQRRAQGDDRGGRR